jgi:lipopolysaccharide transport system permease protein
MTTDLNTNPKSSLLQPVELRSEHAIVIEPSKGWAALHLEDLWRFRELLYFMVWRDLKVRYKQTALGASWAILQPVLTMVIFSIIFGRYAGMPSDSLPYPIFTFTALLPWNYFANAFTTAGNSLITNTQLISKVYFPRLIIPVATTLVGLVDFMLAFVVLGLMMVYYRIWPTWNVIFLPAFLALAVITALGVGLWLSALNVQFRDIRYVIPFLAQFWLYATPVAYSSSIIPDRWRWLYGLNPMAGVVEGFRWALLGKAETPGLLLLASTIVALVICVSGIFYFRRTERGFADII